MGKVFVVHDNGKNDLSQAAEFGERVTLLTGRLDPRDDRHALKLERGLEGFSQDDFLLCVGSPVFIGLATTYAAEASGGRVNFLVWDWHWKRYEPVPIQVWEDEG